MKVYKVLGENGEPVNGGHGKWSLPNRGKPGKWMPNIEGKLVPCENGYHLCRRDDLITWLGPTIYEAEYLGDIVEADEKVVVRQARLIRKLNWNKRTARLFACDCAEWASSLVEEPDQLSIEAVRVARLVAAGQAKRQELAAAGAFTAAWAARAAARAATAAWAARAAAWAATAAGAAGEAAREYMTDRLMEYLEGRA